MIDNRDERFSRNDLSLVRAMCDRHFGIGADGLILVGNCSEADYEMIYFNSDGSMSFCGNGSRCSVAFAKYLGMIGDECTFLAIDGIHKGTCKKDGTIAVSVKDVTVTEIESSHHFIFTGSPHYIVYVKDLEHFDIVATAKEIRYGKRFADEGTNVNFIEENNGSIKVRTYERGVEDETLSCGSGVTACAISYAIKKNIDQGCDVITRGGKLRVSFTRNNNRFTNVILEGPAMQIFKGQWNG
jgi:diaminopimelate epimerase